MEAFADWRLISTSPPLPLDPGYADQPYVVILRDGSWLCLVTSARGHEGDRSQGVFSLWSGDQGKSWSRLTKLEPDDAPENSYAVGLVTPAGRVYAFYNYNSQNQRTVLGEDGCVGTRVDSLGDYVFRYSDDDGVTWSDRHTIPVRDFLCDRNNTYGGKVRFFWNVGKPCVRSNGEVIIPLHKVGAMGVGFFAQSEGAFLSSKNLLSEQNPTKLEFETLPDGDIGLTAPAGGGRIAEEHSVVELSDGSLYTVYRSVDGWPVCSYSRDGGHTWEQPHYKTYRPGGRRMKNPRAANFVWKLSGNRYLYWFHNHGGAFIRALAGHASLPNGLSPVHGRSPYDDRNPAWLCAGREIDGPNGKMLEWSEPEIVLYDDDPMVRISYPDLIEQDGRIWLTETDKASARIHEVPDELVRGLFAQFDEPALDVPGAGNFIFRSKKAVWKIPLPDLPRLVLQDFNSLNACSLDYRGGCSVELLLNGIPKSGDVLFDSRDAEGAGILLRAIPGHKIEAVISDGRTVNVWTSDKDCLKPQTLNYVAFLLDGGPKLMLFVVNGELCDGGEERQFGWGRYNPALRGLQGADLANVGEAVYGIAITPFCLRVSDCVLRHKAFAAGAQMKPEFSHSLNSPFASTQ